MAIFFLWKKERIMILKSREITKKLSWKLPRLRVQRKAPPNLINIDIWDQTESLGRILS